MLITENKAFKHRALSNTLQLCLCNCVKFDVLYVTLSIMTLETMALKITIFSKPTLGIKHSK